MLPLEICIDASVFVASLIKSEISYETSFQTLKLANENEIALFEPEIVLFEFGTAIYRKKMEGEIEIDQVEGLVEIIFRLPLILQWNSFLVQRAASLAEELSFRGIADCYYLALAEKRNIPLITLDGELLQRGRRIFRKIQTPAEFIQS